MRKKRTYGLAALAALALAPLSASAVNIYDKDGITFDLGAKIDAGYQFKHTAKLDNDATDPDGYTNTARLGDGGRNTSRLTFAGTRTMSEDLQAFFDTDLRFGSFHEGKTGISSNDKKVVGLKSKNWGQLIWGTQNIASQQFVINKPHPDNELVKYGVSAMRQSSLTNRTTYYQTPVWQGMAVRASYSFGDEQTKDTGDGNVRNGSVFGAGWEGEYKKMYGAGIAGFRKASGNTASPDDITGIETYLLVKPVKDLRISLLHNRYHGRAGGVGRTFKERNWGLTTRYVVNDWELGATLTYLGDKGSWNGTAVEKNSGRGWQTYVGYRLPNKVLVYGGVQRQDFDKDEEVLGKFDGTKPNFTDKMTKRDETYVRLGMLLEF